MAAHVLIIDAEEPFASNLAAAFHAKGIQTTVTADGKAGLDSARINIPSAIVLSVELPRISGYSICAKLKKDPILADVPVMMIAADATQETLDHHKTLKTRAEAYMMKPFEPHALIAELKPFLGDAAGSSQPSASSSDDSPMTLSDAEVFGEDFSLEALVDEAPLLPDPSLAGVGEIERLREDLAMMQADLEAEREAHAETVRERDRAVAAEEAASTQLHSLSASQLPSSSAGASRELLELKKQLHGRDKQLVDLKDELQAKEREALARSEREMDLESQLVETQEARELEQVSSKQREDELSTMLRQRESELEQSRTQLEATRLESEGHQHRVHELEGVRKSLEEARSTLEASLKSEQQESEDRQNKIHQLRGELSELQTAKSEVDSRLSRVQAELEQALKEKESLSDELSQTQRRLTESQTAHGQAEEALETARIRIQADDDIKDKSRRALEVALELLQSSDEGMHLSA